jgi:hypothetical protein
MIEMIFSLYEICSILILLNIVIPYHWNKFVSHVKSLIIISQIGIFGGNDHKYVVINIWTNCHFQMEDDKIFEVSHF